MTRHQICFFIHLKIFPCYSKLLLVYLFVPWTVDHWKFFLSLALQLENSPSRLLLIIKRYQARYFHCHWSRRHITTWINGDSMEMDTWKVSWIRSTHNRGEASHGSKLQLAPFLTSCFLFQWILWINQVAGWVLEHVFQPQGHETRSIPIKWISWPRQKWPRPFDGTVPKLGLIFILETWL
jgi:hypothetical protein